MRLFWSSLFLAASLASIVSGTDMDDFIDFLKKTVPGIIDGLKKTKEFSLDGKNISLSGPIIEGYLNITSLKIFGLDNIDTSVENFLVTNGKNQSYAKAVIDLPIIAEAGLSINYDMDLGIINQIPLYGNGEININIAQLKAIVTTQLLCDQCSFLGLAHIPQSAEDLSLNLFVRHNKPYITGAFGHPEASDIITSIMNFVEQLICMWFDYNAECLDCIVSPIIERIVNKLLDEVWQNKNDRGPIKYDCACLKSNFSEKHHLVSKLERIIEDYDTLDTDSFAQKLFSDDLIEFYTEVFLKMKELIKAEMNNEFDFL